MFVSLFDLEFNPLSSSTMPAWKLVYNAPMWMSSYRMLSEKSYDGGKSYDAKVMRMTPSMMNDDNSNASHASSHMTMNTMHSMDLEKRSVRQNHSEIEKRRRNKMNNYINELSLLIPKTYELEDKLRVWCLTVDLIFYFVR